MKNKALEFALDFEKKGVNLYMRLASQTDNMLAKKVLYSLAGQEVEHARRIEEIYAQLQGNKGWKPVTADKAAGIEGQVKKFFQAASRTQLKKGAANLKGYETAMKMEKKGFDAYEQFHKQAKSKAEKDFFAQMMKEENKHYESLANVYAYLTDSEDWLQDDESRTWNWMNT